MPRLFPVRSNEEPHQNPVDSDENLIARSFADTPFIRETSGVFENVHGGVTSSSMMVTSVLIVLIALQKIRTLKGIMTGPITIKGHRKIILKYEETGSLPVPPGRGRKPVPSEVEEEDIFQVQGEKNSNFPAIISVLYVAEEINKSCSTLHKILRYYPYKLSIEQKFPHILTCDSGSHCCFLVSVK
ncbi:hypothetical protein AVEN_153623-1 [Araneus ventricosus]|uniref:Paired domain-containing protein n=1 Tax=Araneus ventricosus TaxID=182803 RepID=A0A4Y2BNP8_ARAVE|nr:hypothetical protein AVEN_153623-1 [Araneus ventricosus]